MAGAPEVCADHPMIRVNADKPLKDVKVFGIGLPKTASSSLNTAMQLLGYRGVHFDTRLARLLMAGHEPSWHALYDNFSFANDVPMIFYYDELLATWPNAKFILTVRTDYEAWWRSYVKHASSILGFENEIVFYTRRVQWGWDMPLEQHKAVWIKKAKQHNERVRATIPPGQLLELDLTTEKDPWTKICSFLAEPVPDVEFPWTFAGKATEGGANAVHNDPSEVMFLVPPETDLTPFCVKK